MLKRIYAIGLLAATALGCILTPAAHASQIEVNKQTGTQNAASVGTNNSVYQNLEQTNLQNQLQVPSYGYYRYNPTVPQMQISGQEAKQSGAAIGIGNGVYQNLEQTNVQNQSGL